MHFDRLHYFQTVADELNMTRAAEKLHLSQQALSSQISKLEEEYGALFFERKRPNLVLTPEGRHFAKFAVSVLRQEEEMTNGLRDMRLNYAGTVGVGVTQTRAVSLMPEFIAQFVSRHPRVKVDLDIASYRSNDLERKLIRGELDVIVVPSLSYLPPTIDRAELCKDHFCLSIPRSFIETILEPGQSCAAFAALPLSGQREQILASGLLDRVPFVYGARYVSYRARQFLSRYAPLNSSVVDLYNYENLFCQSFCPHAAVFTLDSSVRSVITRDADGVPSLFLYHIATPESPVSVLLYYPKETANASARLFIDELIAHAQSLPAEEPQEYFAELA